MNAKKSRGNAWFVGINSVLPVLATGYLIYLNRTSDSYLNSSVTVFFLFGCLPMIFMPLVISWIAVMKCKMLYTIPCVVIAVSLIGLLFLFE